MKGPEKAQNYNPLPVQCLCGTFAPRSISLTTTVESAFRNAVWNISLFRRSNIFLANDVKRRRERELCDDDDAEYRASETSILRHLARSLSASFFKAAITPHNSRCLITEAGYFLTSCFPFYVTDLYSKSLLFNTVSFKFPLLLQWSLGGQRVGLEL